MKPTKRDVREAVREGCIYALQLDYSTDGSRFAGPDRSFLPITPNVYHGDGRIMITEYRAEVYRMLKWYCDGHPSDIVGAQLIEYARAGVEPPRPARRIEVDQRPSRKASWHQRNGR